MSGDVTCWWAALSVVGSINLLAWGWSHRALHRRRAALPRDEYVLRRWLLLLSAGYVAGCAYRSFVPVFDVPRLVMVDSWLASVVIGRSVATVAELCFVAQWALLLRASSQATGSGFGASAARVMVPLIAVAETCSWYSVLTTSNVGHVIEETLWGLCAALLVASLFHIWPRCSRRLRPLLALWCAAGLAYVAFMFAVDVSMYWSRWLADEASGRHYLSLAQGVLDVSRRWVVSHRWEDWKSEVAWMTLYFSVAVWLSITLVHAPLPRRRAIAA
ncbi:MAG TPA: hypothetical protein VFK10_07185 [Burkholderiaceae bacterium]|nr:hypothetical protein [Burkholderiaceae bacterium]